MIVVVRGDRFGASLENLRESNNVMDIAIPRIPGWHVTLFWRPWLIGTITLLVVVAMVLVARALHAREH